MLTYFRDGRQLFEFLSKEFGVSSVDVLKKITIWMYFLFLCYIFGLQQFYWGYLYKDSACHVEQWHLGECISNKNFTCYIKKIISLLMLIKWEKILVLYQLSKCNIYFQIGSKYKSVYQCPKIYAKIFKVKIVVAEFYINDN